MTQPGFGLYIHWPFCLSKCPYCDFNSHAGSVIDHGRWRAALLAELDHFASETRDLAPTSVFFGGGTPSLMEPETVAALMEAIGTHWPDSDLEVTLEANPTSVEAGRFRAFRDAGINRLSLGIQALNDESLRFLGRQHSAAEALTALATARSTFERVSFDLIYARPGQSVAAWRDELARALDLAGEHLSLYQLTIEDGTAFAHQDIALPRDDDAVALYELTQEMTEAAGLPAYEISNHARPGSECRHNLTYWRGGDWLGIGPGAHGRIRGEAIVQLRNPGPWLAAVEQSGHGTESRERLDPGSLREERVMMGLRLTRGIDGELADSLDPAAVASLAEDGFLVRDAVGLRVTPKGRLILNAVLAKLLA
ncbi:coproporphyrinogen III oxidase [Paramagnetospirillum kuznetsovii]|uniref:Heme chaperone HemW n=1 Tax=Paramagnetospirillum kuznetsovii TaxID=2053833 RepID=A0A364P3X7_9PROT|nr:radical SAM family heme chaperone HemW [Paramagnetospirillum kuznetsovii]RAU23990.1 coproporphyrinogen III oxidase [Paramagnetospirillum kuznetsovii]